MVITCAVTIKDVAINLNLCWMALCFVLNDPALGAKYEDGVVFGYCCLPCYVHSVPFVYLLIDRCVIAVGHTLFPGVDTIWKLEVRNVASRSWI